MNLEEKNKPIFVVSHSNSFVNFRRTPENFSSSFFFFLFFFFFVAMNFSLVLFIIAIATRAAVAAAADVRSRRVHHIDQSLRIGADDLLDEEIQPVFG
jgi:hypothetical protein